MMKQPPGSFIPRHRDKHYRFKSKNKKTNAKKIIRYCVFLSDWKPGHYFEYDDKPIQPWKKGDILVLEKDVYHRSANAGTTFKYTAQITGGLKESTGSILAYTQSCRLPSLLSRRIFCCLRTCKIHAPILNLVFLGCKILK